ncbi:MAG: Spy/CpxP family protein refolding chaperone [Cocleimonas sp.]|nr:Spy/CpxP family protein refolding chaperone [Cocleimonas sp.]
MTKSKKIVLASVLSILTLGGFAAYAGGGEHCGFGKHGMQDAGKRGEFMVKRMTHKLGLNETQVTHLKAVQQLFAHHHKEKKAKKGGELLSLLDAPSLDQAQALHLLQSRGEERKAKAPEMIAAIAVFTDSLSTEQRATLKKKLQYFSGHGGFGRHFKSE